MAESQTTTKEALEPCPLAHPVREGVKLWSSSAGQKLHIWCYDCGLQFEGRLNQPKAEVITAWNSRASAPIVAPVVDDGDDGEAKSFSTTFLQLETRFQTATSHDEIVTLVWACRALLDEDTECAPFFTPEAQNRQMVHAATLRLYFEHAARVLERQPYPAEVDEIETGFCTPRGQKDVIAKLERGRRLLAAIQAQSPASPGALRDEAEAEQLRIIAYLSYDTIYTDDFCVRCKHEPSNCECAAPVYMKGFEPDEKLKALKVALFQEQRPRAIFDAAVVTTPPSTLAKPETSTQRFAKPEELLDAYNIAALAKAAAEEIARLTDLSGFVAAKHHAYRRSGDEINERGGQAIEQIAAIIERCFSAERVDKDNNEGLQR